MRLACIPVIAVALLCICSPASAAVNLTIHANPVQAHTGEVITLNGTITGISTIAVYLFVTGPDLDRRGVTLDNLNIPAGRGLFTTAPVFMDNGTWTYSWDTSVILGKLKPGVYTIYAVDSPIDRTRFGKEDYATTEIDILPPANPVTEASLEPVLPVLALGCAGIAGLLMIRLQGKRE